MTDFQQKIILVTGASTGVGEGIARELLKRGAKVAITRAKSGTSAKGNK